MVVPPYNLWKVAPYNLWVTIENNKNNSMQADMMNFVGFMIA